jgi:lysozyme family protein
MNFDEAFALLIPREGSYVNNTNDPGGETKFGISKRAYPHLDIKSITLEQAKEIYRTDFWEQSLASTTSGPLAFQLFDCAVNSGTRQSIVLLQRALGVSDDGVAGPKTREALASINGSTALSIRFLAARLRFMTGLSGWEYFGKGWARRIADNMEEVFK